MAALTAALAALVMCIAPTAAHAEVEWLCKPGQKPNPCKGSFETTKVTSEGVESVVDSESSGRPKVDCFYVYPTVSEQLSINADKTVDPAQTAIAEYQASRFARRCRIFAPMYRQVTIVGLQSPEAQQSEALRLAYSDVLEAWKEYLREHNHGRGFVLIGHSQGTRMLRNLLRTEIDPRKGLRERMVSAILLGGNVAVKKGELAGGDFARTPGCSRPAQTGCVIAFSTFNATRPTTHATGGSAAAMRGTRSAFRRVPTTRCSARTRRRSPGTATGRSALSSAPRRRLA
jgi:hypothetical protein